MNNSIPPNVFNDKDDNQTSSSSLCKRHNSTARGNRQKEKLRNATMQKYSSQLVIPTLLFFI